MNAATEEDVENDNMRINKNQTFSYANINKLSHFNKYVMHKITSAHETARHYSQSLSPRLEEKIRPTLRSHRSPILNSVQNFLLTFDDYNYSNITDEVSLAAE